MSDKLRRARDQAEDRLAAMMQEMHERGDLRHLHGRPLPPEEDDPAWLVARMLKQEGFSHPLLERRRDVQNQLQAADARIERLLERHDRLVEAQAHTPGEVAQAFNDGRRLTLQDYRNHLAELNRAIRDYNLSVPTALHIMPIQVDPHMKRVEELVPPLDLGTFGYARRKRSWWDRLIRGKPR